MKSSSKKSAKYPKSREKKSYDQFAFRQIIHLEIGFGFARFFFGGLDEFADAIAHGDLGFEAEALADFCDVGVAMADIAFAVFADDVLRDLLAVLFHDDVGDRIDGNRLAAAYVEDFVIGFFLFEREDVGLRDVMDRDEVALLLAVFEDENGLAAL